MENRDLTVGEPGKVIRSYCLPLFGSMFFQQLYTLADSFVAGRFIGENALASIGNGYEITLLFIAFATGCNTGCSVNAARHFGAKNYKKVRTAITTALLSTAVMCALLMTLGFFGSPFLLHLIHTPEALLADSITYLRIYTGGLGFMFLYNVSTGIFSALGDSKTPFCFLAVSSTANIFLDILFVAQFNMGVAGVGWATFLCQGAACVPAALVVLKKFRKLPTEKVPIVTKESLKDFVFVAIPATLQQGVIVTGNMIIQSVVNLYGAAVTAGYSVAVKLINLTTGCFGTIGNGFTNYTSQNLGAEKPERVRAGFWASTRIVWCIALGSCLLCEFFPTTLVKLFVSNPTDVVLQTAVDFLRIAAPFYFAPAIKIICDGFFCGAKQMWMVVFSLGMDLGLRAGIAAACSAIFKTSFSVWFAWPVGWVIAAVVTLWIYHERIAKMVGSRKLTASVG